MLFNFALEYVIRTVQVIQDDSKFNGTTQLLVYADDVNILDGSVHTIKKNAVTSIVVSKEIGLEVNADDHLCGLVVRVSGYRYRGPGFDSRRYQIF